MKARLDIQFVNDGPVESGEIDSVAASPRGFANQNEPNAAVGRGKAVQEAVFQKMRDAGLNYGAAWNAVQRERPELFAAMKQPQVSLPKFKIKS